MKYPPPPKPQNSVVSEPKFLIFLTNCPNYFEFVARKLQEFYFLPRLGFCQPLNLCGSISVIMLLLCLVFHRPSYFQITKLKHKSQHEKPFVVHPRITISKLSVSLGIPRGYFPFRISACHMPRWTLNFLAGGSTPVLKCNHPCL